MKKIKLDINADVGEGIENEMNYFLLFLLVI